MTETVLPVLSDLPPTLCAELRGPVAVLTLNRPDKRNALSDEIVLGIERFFAGLPQSISVVVLAASPGSWSTG